MPGILFTNYFLEEGILHTYAWQESLSQPANLDAFRTQALTLLERASNTLSINEASTESELINGWPQSLDHEMGKTRCI